MCQNVLDWSIMLRFDSLKFDKTAVRDIMWSGQDTCKAKSSRHDA